MSTVGPDRTPVNVTGDGDGGGGGDGVGDGDGESRQAILGPDREATVLVAGATGRTGREVLRELERAPASVRVRAVTRRESARESLRDRGVDEVVVGDLLDAADARAAVAGCDAVVCVVGSTLATGLVRPWRVVDGTGVVTLVDAAVDAGVRGFVLQSTIGVGDSRGGLPWWARWGLLRWTVRAKARAERALGASRLSAVIVRPGRLTDGPATNDLLVTEGGGVNAAAGVPRADVARLLVAALWAPDAVGRTVEVVARGSADADARAVATVDGTDWTDRIEVRASASSTRGGRSGPSSGRAPRT